MKIKHVKAKCFLSIGVAPIEIDFTKLGNIINIRGHNFDRRQGSSNGAGKSTIMEMIVYGLYGKLLKKMNHKEAINTKVKKGLEVQITFEIGGHEYRIVRRRKPDSLELWKDGDNEELGGMPATQAEIERVVGLTYEAFVNIAFFGQHNQYSFLSCDAATKRQIVENLLALEKYNRYCQVAKEKKKAVEAEVSQHVKDYENACKQVDSANKRMMQIQQQQEQWLMMRQSELEKLNYQLAAKDEEIKNTDQGKAMLAYQAAQEELPTLKEKIEKLTATLDAVTKKQEEYREKLDAKKAEYHDLSLKLNTVYHQIDTCTLGIKATTEALEGLAELKDGEQCPVCHGVIAKDNYHHVEEHQLAQREKFQAELKECYANQDALKADHDKLKEVMVKLNDMLKQCVAKVGELKESLKKLDARKVILESVKEPSVGLHETLLNEQRDSIVKLIKAKEEEIQGGDPYQQMFAEATTERDEYEKAADGIKAQIKEREAKLPYYDYWIKGFGDKGIRSLIIDNIIPALNTRINYWLQFLIDNQIRLNFDNNLEETIETNPPDGDPFVYNGLSGGEHLRINLAISQAFAYLMMLSSGTCPSIVALDEVVTYQDRPGVHCIYAMICELARDRQVIVISHDQDLLQMLEGADTITVERRDGFSTASVVAIR
jgi:DNA repair exonuclease SbcCD ATPase subunit